MSGAGAGTKLVIWSVTSGSRRIEAPKTATEMSTRLLCLGKAKYVAAASKIAMRMVGMVLNLIVD